MITISAHLLVWTAVSETALLACVVFFFIGLHIRQWWGAQRTAAHLARGREIAVAVADGRRLSDGDTMWLVSLPERVQTKLLMSLGRSLEGAERARLQAFAAATGLVSRAEARCRSRLWWRRLHAARLLSLVGGGASVVPGLLKDRHPEVRAQAAEWAGSHPDPGVVEGLLDLLNDPWGLCRVRAQDSLERLGEAVEEPLIRRLTAVRATTGALQVAAAIAGPRFRPCALALARDPRHHIRALAATLLAAIGDPDDVPVLTGLLSEPSAEVRAAATQGLGRLGQWPASPKVGLLLCDPAWIVRREAALALRAMGAPGVLLLRRALSSDDRFAADMAKQTLGLPGPAEQTG